jgi:hypothetical protein
MNTIGCDAMKVKLSKTDMGMLARAVVATDISWSSSFNGVQTRSLDKLVKLGILTDRYMPTELGRAVYIRIVMEEEYSKPSPQERVAERLRASGFDEGCLFKGDGYGKWGVVRHVSDVHICNVSNVMKDRSLGIPKSKPFESLTLFEFDLRKDETVRS